MIDEYIEAIEKEENFNVNHPEIRDGEMFLTNILAEDYIHIGWKTKRSGLQAYTVYGESLSHYVPVFVQKEEYEEGMKKYSE